MSPNHPPSIDFAAIENSLDDFQLTDRVIRPKRDLPTFGTNTANGNGHAGQHRNGAPTPERDAAPPVPRLGAEAADNMTRLAKAAASDIRQLGRLALEAGRRVQEECEEMAQDVESNGGTVALHLTGLSQLLADVGMSNRETMRRLLGDTTPSIVPPAAGGSAHPAKQPAAAEKPLEPSPFAKKRRPEALRGPGA